MEYIKLLNKSIGVYEIKGFLIEPRYWQALVIVILIFLLLLTLARLRYVYVHWGVKKTSLSFLFYGFLLALILEGFLIISGRTLFTELIGWRSAPKPISTFLDLGRERLVRVLGIQSSISSINAKEYTTSKDFILEFKKLSPEEAQVVRSFICSP